MLGVEIVKDCPLMEILMLRPVVTENGARLERDMDDANDTIEKIRDPESDGIESEKVEVDNSPRILDARLDGIVMLKPEEGAE